MRESFGYTTLPRVDKFQLRRLGKQAKHVAQTSPATTVVCARCNQPTNGDRTCAQCSKIGVRCLDPGEIDTARAAAINEILARLKRYGRPVVDEQGRGV